MTNYLSKIKIIGQKDEMRRENMWKISSLLSKITRILKLSIIAHDSQNSLKLAQGLLYIYG